MVIFEHFMPFQRALKGRCIGLLLLLLRCSTHYCCRTFKGAGDLLGPLRLNMGKKTAERMVFLRDNKEWHPKVMEVVSKYLGKLAEGQAERLEREKKAQEAARTELADKEQQRVEALAEATVMQQPC